MKEGLGGGFHVKPNGSLWHDKELLLEPNYVQETENAIYIPSLDAVLTKADDNEGTVMRGGMLFSPQGTILTTDMYDEDSRFTAIWQHVGFKGTPVFVVDVKDRKIANRTNAVLVRKTGDEYKWAFLFPENAMYVEWIEEDGILQCSVKHRDIFKNFSPFDLKYVGRMESWEVTYWEDDENKAIKVVRADNIENARAKAKELLGIRADDDIAGIRKL